MKTPNVSREEIKEIWDRTESEAEKFKSLLDRPYKYSLWLTNVSLGLFGFYVAVLLQIRNTEPLQDKASTILTFIILLISIGYGIFARFKYEVLDAYRSTKSFVNNIWAFLKATNDKFKEKDKNWVEGDGLAENDLRFSSSLLERLEKKPLFWGLIGQFAFFLWALIRVLILLVDYLFE